MREAQIKRTTKETDILLSLSLDGKGESEIVTDCGFFNHMMTLFAKHGSFTLNINCKGDSEVDYHHTVEDIGIALGKAFCDALGDMRGIYRYADIILPMDEALILCAVDISGRGQLYWQASIPAEKVGDFDTELAKEFFIAFAKNAGITLHIQQLAGENSHHIIEGCFKALGRVMGRACAIDEKNKDEIPSTKGVL